MSLWGNEAKIYSLKLYGFVSSGYSLDLWLSVHIDNLIWIRVIWKTNLWTYQWGNSVLDTIEEKPPCNCGLHCFMYSVSEWRKMTKPAEQHNFFPLCFLSMGAVWTAVWPRLLYWTVAPCDITHNKLFPTRAGLCPCNITHNQLFRSTAGLCPCNMTHNKPFFSTSRIWLGIWS